MTSAQDRPLRWYAIAACVFAVPPVLALAGIRFEQRPKDLWFADGLQPAVPSTDATDESQVPPTAVSAEDMASIAVLRADNLFSRQIFVALHAAVAELKEKLPNADISWVGDVPARSGLIRRFRPVVPGSDGTAGQYSAAFEQLREHPLVTGHLLSADGTTMILPMGLTATPQFPIARQILKEHMGPVGVQVRITGSEVLKQESFAAQEEWHYTVLVMAAGMVALAGCLMLRSPRRIAAVSAGPGAAVTMALGWHAFLGLPHNHLAATMAPVFVLVLAFAESLHIFLAVEEEFRLSVNHRVAVRDAMRRMLRPCFLTSLTTSLAFASLMISDQPMVFGFGRNAAIAVVIGFFGVITVLPIAAADCVKRKAPPPRREVRRRDRWIRYVIWLSVKHPAIVVAASLLVTGVMIVQASTLHPDYLIRDQMSSRLPSYQGLRYCDESLGGLLVINVGIEWPEGSSDDDIASVMTAVDEQIRNSDAFSAPLSILNSLEMLPGKDVGRKMRFTRRVARGRMEHFWNPELRRAVIQYRVPDRGDAWKQNDQRNLDAMLKEQEELHPGFVTSLTGACLADSRMVHTTIGEMSWSLFLASAVILAVIWCAYRRISFVLYSLLPNAFAIATTMAVRSVMGESLEIASACAASICMGIAVDDTIHFLEGVRHAGGRFGSRTRIISAGRLVGRALVVTTITLLLGFSTVMLAPLPTHAYFASLVCVMLPTALLGDLIILPAVMSLFCCRHVSQRRSNAATASDPVSGSGTGESVVATQQRNGFRS